MENKEKVKVGDTIRAKHKKHRDILGSTLRCISVYHNEWQSVGKNGTKYSFSNPLSPLFELDKNTIVINILNDL